MGELTALPRPLSSIQEAILLRFLLLMGGEGRTRKIVHPEKFLRIGPDTHLARLALWHRGSLPLPEQLLISIVLSFGIKRRLLLRRQQGSRVLWCSYISEHISATTCTWTILPFLPPALLQALSNSVGFEDIALQEWHAAPIWVQFGVEESTS